jgi:hypothetical protein
LEEIPASVGRFFQLSFKSCTNVKIVIAFFAELFAGSGHALCGWAVTTQILCSDSGRSLSWHLVGL